MVRKPKRELYNKIGLSKEDVKLLNDYFAAFSNFYGRMPLGKAFEIINEQNDNKFEEETLLKFAESKKSEKNFYSILDPEYFYDVCENLGPLDKEIVNESLYSVDDKYYYELYDAQEGKPICVLPKEKFLKYADDFYREETPATRTLEEFIEKNVKILQPPTPSGCVNTAKSLVDEYVLGLTIDTSFDDTGMNELLRLADLPKDEEAYISLMNKIIPLAMEVHNTTRMWANRGYTPREIATLLGSPIPEDVKTFRKSVKR